MTDGVRVVAAADLEWEGPALEEAPTGDEESWLRGGPPKRARVLRGEGGYHVELVSFPPGFHVYPHSHSADELFVILDGGCSFDGRALAVNDTLLISADTAYSFTAGSEGLKFLIVRPAASVSADRRAQPV